MAYSGDINNLLSDVNQQKSDDYFRGLGFDKGRQGASDYLAQQRDAMGGITQEEKQAYQRKIALEAVQPAISSLQASLPEVRTSYEKRAEQVSAEKTPLIDRYQQLLDEIRGRETGAVNTATRTINREMGRRGIPLSSTFSDQEVQGQTAPIHQAAQSDILSTTFDREAKLREIDNTITQLNSEKIAAERDINNTIAQIQANAGTQAAQNALQQYQFDQQQRQATLDRLLQERQLAATIDASKLTANTAAIKEVQGGLFNTQTNQWVVQPKATGTGVGNISTYLPSAGFVGTPLSGSSSVNTNSSSNSGWRIIG